MMKFGKLHAVIIIVLVLTFMTVPIVQAVTADPGSEDDPIVSKSYVDEQVEELEDKVDELTDMVRELTKKIQVLESNGPQGNTAGGSKFEVLRLTQGQQLIAGESAEIIVRYGNAVAISGINGDGLSDITSDQGGDLFTGDPIPVNHLLLVSRDDGRGLVAEGKEVFLLIRGEYSIK
ncbi:MAG: hypothetical protein ACOX7R_00175 [Acetivibrionales bacterium]|jgi:uncharacterized protein YlxW (UPF0749 family)